MFNKRKRNAISPNPNENLDFIKEKFYQIQTNLQFSRTVDNQVLKSLVITSPNKGEGKSFCVWNLGKSLATNNRRVLLIDGDMYKARLSKNLNVYNQPGLSDILISGKHPSEVIVDTMQSNVYILPAGTLPPNPVKLINSGRMREIINLLEKEFDMILFDTPPVLVLSDSRIISNMCNGVIVVVRCGLTKKKDLAATMELLNKANTYVVGTILNGRTYGRREMSSYSYY
ncbi:capsular biosynthesis protein [Bacillus cereus]|uniref:CpsD/CapB family tyrosine-protein kinase n=1 Tax=Bacillus cereus TaxID=1396 RepID=UPI000BF4CE24|nr:CpsD/CapB family tyrosine-protein kinase [Bacillus cereus]PEX06318.1 capsular biosynthesis protein [Bacillus cereus]PGV18306.1 capsular biosynthesis protein [Bacillus cereus]